MFIADSYDVAVVGAGHAGIEAALAASRLGMRTCLFSISLDSVANLPCNPSIGGTAKGHLVREIDALGGEMGKAADATFIQSRILNRGKGPAVHSLRAQIDRRKYQNDMKHRIELTENLDLRQAEIVDVTLDENGAVRSVIARSGAEYFCKAAILCTGTYLKARIIIGEFSQESGPDGVFPATELSQNLKRIGLNLVRFKTGTPPRINKRSIDFSKLEEQWGDEEITPFSFETKGKMKNQSMCYITYTNEKTKQIILDNLHRSPLYGGDIKGIGPRYCPSIEDKIVRFKDKERHQLFVEPMGLDTEEMYLQGFSSSMPEDVQIEMIHSLPGFEHAQVMRNAYAIEYDCIDPLQLNPSLELKKVPGLYGAGQFNGTSGYEEAAAQGLMAGINAARKLSGKEPVVIDRSEAYIGALIDDLVTKGTNEPYRMMTSRSEYRLLLRQDNADLRLTPLGYEIGLISEERFQAFLEKKAAIEKEIERLEGLSLSPTEAMQNYLKEVESTPLSAGIRAAELLKRPQVTYEGLGAFDPDRPEICREVAEQVEISIKYEGYIKRQLSQAAQFAKLEAKKLPADMDYLNLDGLRLEARQKLDQIRPASLGQASRISGVSPADITVLMIYLKTKGNKEE